MLASGASLENLAAAAYLGQINRIQDRNLLATLLAIHTVEGRQAAAMNRLAGRGFSLGTGALEGATPDGAFAEPMDMKTVQRNLRRLHRGRRMTMTRAQLLVRAAVVGGVAAAGPLAARAMGDIKDDLSLAEYLLTMEYVQSGLYRDGLKEVPNLSDEARQTRLRPARPGGRARRRAAGDDRGGRRQRARAPAARLRRRAKSESRFLKLANTLEDTAVSAYNGAAPRLESRELLAVFASIAQIEARHSALIRLLRDKPPAPLAFDKASNRQDVRTTLREFEVR